MRVCNWHPMKIALFDQGGRTLDGRGPSARQSRRRAAHALTRLPVGFFCSTRTRYVGDTLCDATTRKPARKTSRHHPAAVPVRPGAEAGRVGAIGVNILAHERPSWPVESLVTPGAHWSRLMSTGAGLERACTPRTWHTRDARPISDAPLASLTPYTSVPGAPVGPPCEAGPWSSTHKRRRISVTCAGMGPRGARIEQL